MPLAQGRSVIQITRVQYEAALALVGWLQPADVPAVKGGR